MAVSIKQVECSRSCRGCFKDRSLSFCFWSDDRGLSCPCQHKAPTLSQVRSQSLNPKGVKEPIGSTIGGYPLLPWVPVVALTLEIIAHLGRCSLSSHYQFMFLFLVTLLWWQDLIVRSTTWANVQTVVLLFKHKKQNKSSVLLSMLIWLCKWVLAIVIGFFLSSLCS